MSTPRVGEVILVCGVGVLLLLLLDNLVNDRWANQARLRAFPEQIEILKAALSPAQRQRYDRCERATPCSDVNSFPTRLKCHTAFMRSCMFQPREKAE